MSTLFFLPSLAAIDALHKQGVRTMIRSDESKHTARTILMSVNLGYFRVHPLSASKRNIVTELAKGNKIAMTDKGADDAR